MAERLNENTDTQEIIGNIKADCAVCIKPKKDFQIRAYLHVRMLKAKLYSTIEEIQYITSYFSIHRTFEL